MKKETTYLVMGGAALAFYLLVIKPGSTPTPFTFTAYDGTSKTINVESNITPAAKAQIAGFFGTGGTMPNSVHPATDEAALEASLKSQGFPLAAAGVLSTYNALLQTAGQNLASGFGAGALMGVRPGIYQGAPYPALGGGFGAGQSLAEKRTTGTRLVSRGGRGAHMARFNAGYRG